MPPAPNPAVALKIAKAEEFLLSGELALEIDAFDSATSLAVSAAINASDALIIAAGQPLPRGRDHGQAVTILRHASDLPTSRQLGRALQLKNKAQYDLNRCTRADAEDAIKVAERLIAKARGS